MATAVLLPEALEAISVGTYGAEAVARWDEELAKSSSTEAFGTVITSASAWANGRQQIGSSATRVKQYVAGRAKVVFASGRGWSSSWKAPSYAAATKL